MCMSFLFATPSYAFVASDSARFLLWDGGHIDEEVYDRRMVRCPRLWVASTGQIGAITESGDNALEVLDSGEPYDVGKALNTAFMECHNRIHAEWRRMQPDGWASATFHVAALSSAGIWAARLSALGYPLAMRDPQQGRRPGVHAGVPAGAAAFWSWARPNGLSDAFIDRIEPQMRAAAASPLALPDAIRSVAGWFVATRVATRWMNGDLYVAGYYHGRDGRPMSFGRIEGTAAATARAGVGELTEAIERTTREPGLALDSRMEVVR